MNKNTSSFLIKNITEFKIQMLNWANQFNIFCLLDNQQYHFDTPAFETMLAVGCKKNITANAGNAFEKVYHFSKENTGWLLGHLGYDLKNETEQLSSNNMDGIGFPDLHFFEPEIVLQLNENLLTIFADVDVDKIYRDILASPLFIEDKTPIDFLIKNRITQQAYIDTVNKIKAHIVRGDCYEINFCQEFYAENATIHPLSIYQKLAALSPNPFSALYKLEDKYCICASPERYLKKIGNKISSQPIKGTVKRNLVSAKLDEANKQSLINSQKEKSENVMVVDLVRNDLSKICEEGSVKVEELFGIYSFPHVHQMISTVSGNLPPNTHWAQAIQATFPMGSMTGAPKKKVMELIEKYEESKRGLFSGAIGYIAPNGDFDFNVVIRSILYNASNGYVSFQTGSAITFYCNAENEYEECLLKANVMQQVLGQTI